MHVSSTISALLCRWLRARPDNRKGRSDGSARDGDRSRGTEELMRIEAAGSPSVPYAAESQHEPSLLRQWFPPSIFRERTSVETAARSYPLRSMTIVSVDPSKCNTYSLWRQASVGVAYETVRANGRMTSLCLGSDCRIRPFAQQRDATQRTETVHSCIAWILLTSDHLWLGMSRLSTVSITASDEYRAEQVRASSRRGQTGRRRCDLGAV